jgi:hypothetical protein
MASLAQTEEASMASRVEVLEGQVRDLRAELAKCQAGHVESLNDRALLRGELKALRAEVASMRGREDLNAAARRKNEARIVSALLKWGGILVTAIAGILSAAAAWDHFAK